MPKKAVSILHREAKSQRAKNNSVKRKRPGVSKLQHLKGKETRNDVAFSASKRTRVEEEPLLQSDSQTLSEVTGRADINGARQVLEEKPGKSTSVHAGEKGRFLSHDFGYDTC